MRRSVPSWLMCWCMRSVIISGCPTPIWKQSKQRPDELPRSDAGEALRPSRHWRSTRRSIVQTMHPTLLIGPADWDAAGMPRQEFEGRIAALWDVCEPDVARVIVFGSARHHAELAWFTHFTPKLEPGLALIERCGAVRLFVGGGVNMLDAARPLTWVDELLPLYRAPKAIA